MTGQGEVASSCTSGGCGWVLGTISSLKEWLSVGQAAQDSGGFTTPGSVQGMTGYDTLQYWGHGVIQSKVGADDLGGFFQPQ